MPPWLQRLLGGGLSLQETIEQVLGGRRNEIHPELAGGRLNPIQLPPISNVPRHETPYVADTLQALVGSGVRLRADDTPRRDMRLWSSNFLGPTSGNINLITGTITYNPNLPPESLDNTLAHEFGHVHDARNLNQDAASELRKRFNEVTGYGATSKGEHHADAFEVAVDLLRSYMQFPNDLLHEDPASVQLFDEDLNRIDNEVPGAKALAIALAQHPIWGGKHIPLLRSLNPQAPYAEYLPRGAEP